MTRPYRLVFGFYQWKASIWHESHLSVRELGGCYCQFTQLMAFDHL